MAHESSYGGPSLRKLLFSPITCFSATINIDTYTFHLESVSVYLRVADSSQLTARLLKYPIIFQFPVFILWCVDYKK